MSIANTNCVLLPGFFQVGYVSNDLERAQETLGEHFGIERYHQMLDLELDENSKISIATAYVGATMIEIIMPHGHGENLYSEHLPPTGDFALRHHHFGHLYANEAEWRHMRSLIQRHPIAFHSHLEGLIEAIYIDTRPILGHYLEYIHATPAGLDFLNQAPQNA